MFSFKLNMCLGSEEELTLLKIRKLEQVYKDICSTSI